MMKFGGGTGIGKVYGMAVVHLVVILSIVPM
jgi:hypothetical protein